jgi:pSer/pThr/pTyr-binding forkhead associated (FHA) protein
VHAFLEVWSAAGPSTLPLPDDAEVSRLHAVLEVVGPSWVVRDLSSRNGPGSTAT